MLGFGSCIGLHDFAPLLAEGSAEQAPRLNSDRLEAMRGQIARRPDCTRAIRASHAVAPTGRDLYVPEKFFSKNADATGSAARSYSNAPPWRRQGLAGMTRAAERRLRLGRPPHEPIGAVDNDWARPPPYSPYDPRRAPSFASRKGR